MHRRGRHPGQPGGGHRIGGDDDVLGANGLGAVGGLPARARPGQGGHFAPQIDQAVESCAELTRQRLHPVGGQGRNAEGEHANEQQCERIRRDTAVLEQHAREESVDDATQFAGDPGAVERGRQRAIGVARSLESCRAERAGGPPADCDDVARTESAARQHRGHLRGLP